MTPELRKLYQNDTTVHRILRSGGTLEECVLELARQKNDLTAQVQRLSLIAPKRMTDANGVTWVWHLPDYLIPETETILDSSWTTSPPSAPT